MARTTIAPGAVIDGFVVGELVHRGGMAALWSVTRPGESMPMLMKVPRLAEGEDPAAIVSFEMEQMILPRLAGPHVARFVAAGDFAVHPYLVFERLPGDTMLPRLAELPLAPEEVAGLGARIATALDSVHRQHVIHLDLKPANVMFRPGGEAVLIDFGLAHHARLPDLMAEEFRLPYGSAPYMAPEQVVGVRSDPRSDLFALGSLLYLLATAERPFGDPLRLSGLRRRLWRDPHPPRRLRPAIPPWLQEIILRCLEINPAWRHPTAAQLAFDLLHPEQVKLTARAERRARDDWRTVLRRRFHPEPAPTRAEIAAATAAAPIVAVAIDVSACDSALAETLRATVARILQQESGARLACINVLRQSRVTLDSTLDEQGRNRHVERLVALKHWAEPLRLTEGGATFHVLEAVDPADAILDYARTNPIDHIVMGARANSTMRRLLGSVSGKVAAEAPCTVTVVRPRASGQAAESVDQRPGVTP